MQSNKAAIGPSGESLIFFSEFNKVSVNLSAFRGHSCLSVTSKELIFKKKLLVNMEETTLASISVLRSFSYDPFNHNWDSLAVKLN